ncbi:MAG: hypothetical protein FWF87_05470 [Synergistaceae bacterium]|nr:hypothetical protein [Synergistaceae bacterium]
MPPQWMSHIPRLLENSLPEGQRRDSLIRLALREGNRPSNPIELLPYVADLPGHFSVGHSRAVHEINGSERKFSPLPESIPQSIIETRLPSACFNSLSELRLNERPSFSGYQDKFTAKLLIEENRLLLLPVDQEAERGNVTVK